MAMVVGKHAVPVHTKLLSGDNGVFTPHNMVYLSHRDHDAPSWLWSCLGFDGYSRNPIATVPLFQEIGDALRRKRTKRKANVFLDSSGEVLPTLVHLTVRGENILAGNNRRSICVNLGDSLTLMNWFLAEMWKDLTAASGRWRGADPGEVQDRVRGKVKKKTLVKNTQEKITRETIGPPGFQNLLKKTLENLKANDQVKFANFDRRHGKFRVVLRSQAVKHKTIRTWKSMYQDENLDSMQAALEDTARNLLLEVLGAGLEPPGHEPPGHDPPGLQPSLEPLAEFGDDGVVLGAEAPPFEPLAESGDDGEAHDDDLRGTLGGA